MLIFWNWQYTQIADASGKCKDYISLYSRPCDNETVEIRASPSLFLDAKVAH